MTIYCIFAQRIESYEGQYAPELIKAMYEYGNDDNPDFLNDAEKKAIDSREFTIIKRLGIEIPEKHFVSAFNPRLDPILGRIKK